MYYCAVLTVPVVCTYICLAWTAQYDDWPVCDIHKYDLYVSLAIFSCHILIEFPMLVAMFENSVDLLITETEHVRTVPECGGVVVDILSYLLGSFGVFVCCGITIMHSCD